MQRVSLEKARASTRVGVTGVRAAERVVVLHAWIATSTQLVWYGMVEVCAGAP